jgi:SNF family Na+-dependent transporter
MKISRSVVASAVFFVLLAVFYVVHIKYFRVDVVFYSAIFDGVFAAIVATVVLYKLSYFSLFTNFEKGQMAAIWLLVGYAFAISVPTVIDRSLSFYILEKIHQRGGGIQLSKFEEVFTREYVKEHRLVDVRLTEQQASGTIVIQDGCVKLTERGEQLAKFSRYFRQNLLPTRRLLMGEYSDDLTNPFRNSMDKVTYECQ